MEKSSPSPYRPPPQMAYFAELRKESSPAAIAFSDPCPCCGNKKRRCLLPSPPPSRKKLLVLDLPTASPSPMPSPPSLTSPASSISQISDFISRRTAPALQDSCSFTRRRSVPALPAEVISLAAVIAPAVPQQAEIQDSGSFNRRRSDPTSPTLQDSGYFKVRRSNPTSPAMKTPAEKKEPEGVIVPPVACEYGGGERSNSSVSSLAKPVDCSAENDKRGGGGGEEFRVELKCKCGVVREFVLTS